MMLCYSVNNGTAQVAGGGTKYCGSYTGVAQYCCANNDFCVGSSICYFTRPSEGYGNSSGYYIGSCTDESFSSPECSRECCELSHVYMYRRTVYLTDLRSGSCSSRYCIQRGQQFVVLLLGLKWT